MERRTACEPLQLMMLPVEVLHTVLSSDLLDLPGLLRCRQVCRQLRTLIDSSSGLQYKIELAEAGMVDGPQNDSLPTASRLAKLRAHQKAWRQVKWTTETPLEMSKANAWELIGGVLGIHVPGAGFTFTMVPSDYRDVAPKEWKVDCNLPCLDFSIDPSQNLLVALDKVSKDDAVFNLQLLSLASGHPHPLATNPILCTSLSVNPPDEWAFEIKISGNHLGVMFFNDGDEASATEFSVWDWKTGEIKSSVADVEFESFLFLTDDLVVVSLCDLMLFDQPTPTLQVFPIQSSTPHPGEMVPIAIFQLPVPHHKREMFPVELLADTPSHSDYPVPFATNPVDRLIVANFQVYDLDGDVNENFAVFFPLSAILKRMEKGSDSRFEDAEGAPLCVFEWFQWGPTDTRMIDLELSHVWVCFVQGMRAIIQGPETAFRLFDFNPLSLRRCRDSGEQPADTQYLFDTTTVSKHEEVFADGAIETSLPCRITTGTLPFESVVDVMLSEDGIITVSKDGAQLGILSF